MKKAEAELIWFKEQLQLLNKIRMGKKSEKSDHGQLSLFNDIEEHADIETETLIKEEKAKQEPKKKKEADYNNLPTKDYHHELEDKTCVVCGSELKELAPTIVSTLEFQPARFIRKRHIIHHYVCKKCSDENGDAQIYDAEDAPKN